MKKIIIESQLRHIVKESVTRVLNEISAQHKGAAFIKAFFNLQQIRKAYSTNKNEIKRLQYQKEIQRLDRLMELFKGAFIQELAEYLKIAPEKICIKFLGAYDENMLDIYIQGVGALRASAEKGLETAAFDKTRTGVIEKAKEIILAMAGYQNSLFHDTDNYVSDLDASEKYDSEVRKYNDNYDKWYKKDRETKDAQRNWDYHTPWFKKIGKTRPADFTDPAPEYPVPPTYKTRKFQERQPGMYDRTHAWQQQNYLNDINTAYGKYKK